MEGFFHHVMTHVIAPLFALSHELYRLSAFFIPYLLYVSLIKPYRFFPLPISLIRVEAYKFGA